MGLNVLIVDDSGVMRTMIQKILQIIELPLGEIFQAGNGRAGLELLHRNWIDLVVADINMPVMSGEEMISAMQESPELKGIPVLVVSTEGSSTRIERLRALGARFLHKPFTPETFRDVVMDILGTGEDR
jgi:two-component system chemotaxis response regulator CheY